MTFTSTIRKVLPEYGYTTPTREEVLTELEKTKYTPDLSKLEEQEWHRVFVCDELKKDHLKHSLLGDDRQYAGPAFTQKEYRFWENRDDQSQSPIPMKTVQNETGTVQYFPPLAKIKGELYNVRTEQMIALDFYKQNTVEYRRQRVQVILPWRPLQWIKDPYLDPNETRSGYRPTVKLGDERVHVFSAWMYLGRRPFWEPHLTAYSFKPVSVFNSERNWCKQFYHVKKPRRK